MSKANPLESTPSAVGAIRTLLALALALGLLVLPGCSDLGGGGGELTVSLQDGIGSGLGGAGFEGELRTVVMAEVQDDFGFWAEVTGSPQQVNLPVGESDTVVEFGRRTLASGTYTRMRLVFTQVEAHLTDAPPGFEMPSDGVVQVVFSTGDRTTVERPATLFIDSDQDAEVIFTLNSGQWLPSGEDGTVTAQSFRSAVTIDIP